MHLLLCLILAITAPSSDETHYCFIYIYIYNSVLHDDGRDGQRYVGGNIMYYYYYYYYYYKIGNCIFSTYDYVSVIRTS